MKQNELGDEVPQAVAQRAAELSCCGGVKYVYQTGRYGTKGPAASIGGSKATRFSSGRHQDYQVPLGEGWLAFRSPSSVTRAAISGIVPPLFSRVGEVTRTTNVDGSPLVFRVIEEEVALAPSNPKKAFCLHKILVDDGAGIDAGHVEYRISYYMIIHKASPRQGTWGFGQFATMMTPAEMEWIVRKMKARGWISEYLSTDLPAV